MPTAAKGSFGSKLQICKADGTTWLDVIEVGDFSPQGQDVQTEDVTTHSSEQGWSEHIPNGVTESGQITGNFNWVEANAGQLEMRAAYSSKRVALFRAVESQGQYRRQGAGIVTNITEPYNVRGRRAADFVIKCTGYWNYVPNT